MRRFAAQLSSKAASGLLTVYIHPVFSRILRHYLRPPCEAILDKILIRGARTHNLKNIDLTLPRDKLIVITGLSGSGN